MTDIRLLAANFGLLFVIFIIGSFFLKHRPWFVLVCCFGAFALLVATTTAAEVLQRREKIVDWVAEETEPPTGRAENHGLCTAR